MEGDIDKHPHIDLEGIPEEFQGIFRHFEHFAASNAEATQRIIGNVSNDLPSAPDDQSARDLLDQMLDLTQNGRGLSYDQATEVAIAGTAGWTRLVEHFRSIKKDNPEIENERRKVALFRLGVFTTRAAEYSPKPKKRKKIA